MAAAVVGEAFLSAFIEVIIDKLASPEVVNWIRGKKFDDTLIQRVKNTLYAVEAVLNDAEQKQIKDSAVNKWLDDLKDAVYVADDILDHISTKTATLKNNNKDKEKLQVSSSNFFSRYFNFHDSEREIVSNLENIVARLDSILKLKDILGLEKIERSNTSWRTPSSSLDDGFDIYGRDEDKKAILKLLSDDDVDGKRCVTVIPIVGMGGVGKTTLAQSLYNDHSMELEFDLQAWVCVSDDFDVLKVTKTLMGAVTKSACNINDINLLHLDLKERLAGKKFFIVFDDVWTEDYVAWNDLLRPLQCGAKGSKILVTTRSEKVASVVQSFHGYHLEQLSDGDCWSVFANHACLSSESSDDVDLRKIGKEIVRKCKGLPLAAQSLGGLLRGKRDISDWNNILTSSIWEISEDESKIIPALRISYHYLPPCLKRCFVYCSLYPKDYEFDKDELILLWMAEDLLQPSNSGKTLEEIGYGYFNDLASRSFFQKSRRWNVNQCFVMHDLVHDLAIFLGGEFYFRTEKLGKETKIGIKTRHLSFSDLNDPVSENFEIFSRAKCLRTFLSMKSRREAFNNEEEAPHIILSNLKYLRVLSFENFSYLDTLPDLIGELIHLRYLDLSYAKIKTLPESLCSLYNLQTLKLAYCYKLISLPNGMQNLVNLRHLDISGTEIEEMPREMRKLIHLQHLSDFVVGKHEEMGIKELGTLSNLHGSILIRKLENVTNNSEALEARIMDKKHLMELKLEWSLDAKDDFTDSQSEMDILDKLQPTKNLERLYIDGYRGTRFPEWVGDPSYHKITSLDLYRCSNCCILPPLGQLHSLKHLVIRRLNMLVTIGSEFYNDGDSISGTVPFPSLEFLEFNNLPCWEVWNQPHESNVCFPKLDCLIINDCPKLRGDLPTQLPALKTIEIKGCHRLAFSLPSALAMRKLAIRESNKVIESVFESIAITPPTSLRELYIHNCSFVISFPLESFPNLGRLYISKCENLECFSVSESLQNLNSITIDGCPNFVSFSKEGLSAPNLTRFTIANCFNLKSLPCHINTLLPNLQKLTIDNCPAVETFPEGGMPPSLRSLHISRNCEKLLRNPSLTSMVMLTSLYIRSPCDGLESFPKDGFALLPPSLTFLQLNEFSSLHTLECTGMLHLTSLQRLLIQNCPKLENMAGETLPSSLIKLEIIQCPLLKELCSMKHPQIWPKISHIREIWVNYTRI